jgi:hypothetical protein
MYSLPVLVLREGALPFLLQQQCCHSGQKKRYSAGTTNPLEKSKKLVAFLICK